MQISRAKHCLDKTSLLTAINALVFSKLYYCSNVWANTIEKNIRKLQAVQNFACRIVSGARKYDHVTPHLKRLSWLPVKDQLYYRQAIMAFKCISGHAPKYLTSQFVTREQVTKRATRSGQKLNITLFKTASGQRTFYYIAIGLWNNLDPFLKSSRSVLPVEQRITFKILLFVFKSLNGLAPFYLSDLISTYVPSRSLRSASLSLLHVPRSNQKTYGDRAFAVAAPRLWNALPIQMRQPGTALDTFKRSLKTLLFKQAFYRFL